VALPVLISSSAVKSAWMSSAANPHRLSTDSLFCMHYGSPDKTALGCDGPTWPHCILYIQMVYIQELVADTTACSTSTTAVESTFSLGG